MAIIATKEKRVISSREAQGSFGKLLDTALREPITIQRHGRDVAVIISAEEYEKIFIEDRYWGERTIAAQKRGYISEKKSEAILNALMHAAR